MTHPWLDAQDVPSFMVSVTRNPDWRERWVNAACDNLNIGEETIEDVHAARRGKEGDEDDTVLSYAMVEKDTDGHDS